MKIKTIRLILSWVGCALTGAALITSCSNEDILQGSQETRSNVEDSITFSGISQESAATAYNYLRPHEGGRCFCYLERN